jgi:hypothetical protein
MKVITLKQPWATLIAKGYKQYEFRSWQTKYRGPLLIHAGKSIDKEALERFEDMHLDYPQGYIIAQVNLDDCILIDEFINQQLQKDNRRVYGTDSKIGIYAWKLSNVQIIDNDKKMKGQLGLWNIKNL